jgi:prevent-host-death family protein
MSKELTVEELRKNADELIAAIEQGESVTITREGKPFATLTPASRGYQGVPYPFRNFDFGPRPKNLRTDPAQLIIEERERERSEKKWRS